MREAGGVHLGAHAPLGVDYLHTIAAQHGCGTVGQTQLCPCICSETCAIGDDWLPGQAVMTRLPLLSIVAATNLGLVLRFRHRGHLGGYAWAR